MIKKTTGFSLSRTSNYCEQTSSFSSSFYCILVLFLQINKKTILPRFSSHNSLRMIHSLISLLVIHQSIFYTFGLTTCEPFCKQPNQIRYFLRHGIILSLTFSIENKVWEVDNNKINISDTQICDIVSSFVSR